jgi:hypothetical protein
MNSNICIVGGGMNLRKHITIEGLDAIRNSASTLVITGDFDSAREVLALHGVLHPIIDLMPLYEDGGLDEDNYGRILSAILDEVLRVSSVTVIVNGDPLVGVSWWNKLKDSTRFSGTIRLVPGISSMVNAFYSINRDPIEAGCTVVDANRFLLFKYETTHELDLLILDICSTGTRRTFLSDPSRESQWDCLCDVLERKYPLEHMAYLVFCEMHDTFATIASPTKIGDLREGLKKVIFGSSLLIPACDPTTLSHNFLRKLLMSNRIE